MNTKTTPLPGEDEINDLLNQAYMADIVVEATPDGGLKVTGSGGREQAPIRQRLKEVIGRNKSFVNYIVRKRKGELTPLESVESKAHNTMRAVEDFVIPSTTAGKLSMGAVMAAGAIPGLDLTLLPMLGLGAAAGEVGAMIDRQNPGKGALEGMINASGNEILGAAGRGAKYVKAWWDRPGILERSLMANFGAKAADILKFLPNTSKRIIGGLREFGIPGKDTVIRVLNSQAAHDELSKYWQDTQDIIIQAVQQKADTDTNLLAQDFAKQFGWDPRKPKPSNIAIPQNLQSQFEKTLEAWNDHLQYARTISGDMAKAFNEIGGENRAIHNDVGELKNTYSAWKIKNNTIPELREYLDKEIYKADPSGELKNLLEERSANYSRYKGLENLVNTDNVRTPDNKWFQANVLQQAMDSQTNKFTRFNELRLRQDFPILRNIVRRGAKEFDEKGAPIISDILRGQWLNKARMGESVGKVGRAFGSIPGIPSLTKRMTHFIGPEAEIPAQLTPRAMGVALPPLAGLNSQLFKPSEPSKEPPPSASDL